jgi:hypothetical protein
MRADVVRVRPAQLLHLAVGHFGKRFKLLQGVVERIGVPAKEVRDSWLGVDCLDEEVVHLTCTADDLAEGRTDTPLGAFGAGKRDCRRQRREDPVESGGVSLHAADFAAWMLKRL